MFMSDHIKNVAERAKRGGKYILEPMPQCGVPITLLDGRTSYICYPAPPPVSECQLNKIQLYPHGKFYPVVPYNKYRIIPGDCGCTNN